MTTNSRFHFVTTTTNKLTKQIKQSNYTLNYSQKYKQDDNCRPTLIKENLLLKK